MFSRRDTANPHLLTTVEIGSRETKSSSAMTIGTVFFY